MTTEGKLKALKALGDPTRLHILEFLSVGCCQSAAVDEEGGVEGPTAGEVCCHITGAQKITSTVSHHLHELQAAELIQIERKGKFMVCNLNKENLESVADHIRAIAKGEIKNECC
jgi:ArsR family transcriptional regulator, arsenate/arsenite/antimonite-responsive transcriptional repressor